MIIRPNPVAYAELSGAAVRRIIEFDREAGYGGPEGAPNRTRFYQYLTQHRSDVQVRTVAVKAARRDSAAPLVKEVVLTSVDDGWMYIRDIAFCYMGGYVIDWSPQGITTPKHWDYRGRWESEAYDRRCKWKLCAPVVNPELLQRSRRFKWCAWQNGTAQGHILDYLKTYSDHPEIEFLSKSGLGYYAAKISVVRKLKKEKAFRQFFSKHAAHIMRQRLPVDVIMKAYNHKLSFTKAAALISARREFRFMNLPRGIDAARAAAYVAQKRILRADYTRYLNCCRRLELDLGDTKVAFPFDFAARSQVAQDRVNVMREMANAKASAETSRKLVEMAEAWSHLERRRGTLRFVLPRSVEEFIQEGRRMQNCLGESYAAQVARGEILVVFVREAARVGESYVAVSYDLRKNRIDQCYMANNQPPPKGVAKRVERALAVTELKAVA